MKKITVAIIGFGKMGKIRYLSLIKHGGFNVVALCDTKESNMNGYVEKKYTDWKRCIDECHPQSIFVCTVNSVIADVVCYALENGLHVFSEKPPGRSLYDAQRMRDSHLLRNDLVLKFGFNHRYHNSIIEAKALVESGIIGDIVCIRGVYGKAGNQQFQSEWRNNLNVSGGGILLDQGIHMLDLIQFFIGELITQYSSVDNLVWKDIPAEDSAYIVFKTKDGKLASLHSSCIQWKHKFDMDIICEKGYIALNGILTSTQSYGEERITFYKKDLKANSGKIGNPIEYTMCFDSDESWDLEIEEFYDAVVFGKEIKNGTDLEALQVMKLIDSIYKNNGRKYNDN